MMKKQIKKPIITERSIEKAKNGFYSFAVSVDFTKSEIKQAVEEQFKVNVVNVRTITMPGKSKRAGKYRKENKSSPWKKAIVKLKKEQTIPIFEVGS